MVKDGGQSDLYDARVGGGFSIPPLPAIPCKGEACQPAIEPPREVTPASSAFIGSGNVKPKHCPKGKNRYGKCVKKKKHKKRGKGANMRGRGDDAWRPKRR